MHRSPHIFVLLVGFAVIGCASKSERSATDPAAIIQAAETAEVPAPAKTPFASHPEIQTAYLESYRAGYRSGLTWMNVLFDVPQDSDLHLAARKQGWQDGARAGFRPGRLGGQSESMSR